MATLLTVLLCGSIALFFGVFGFITFITNKPQCKAQRIIIILYFSLVLMLLVVGLLPESVYESVGNALNSVNYSKPLW